MLSTVKICKCAQSKEGWVKYVSMPGNASHLIVIQREKKLTWDSFLHIHEAFESCCVLELTKVGTLCGLELMRGLGLRVALQRIKVEISDVVLNLYLIAFKTSVLASGTFYKTI